MHEYSLICALMDRVEVEVKAHRATAVRRIRLRVGELSGVEIDLLESAFDLLRESSPCAGAELEIVPCEARWICPRCETALPRDAPLRCQMCASPARLEAGGEIILDQIELEVA